MTIRRRAAPTFAGPQPSELNHTAAIDFKSGLLPDGASRFLSDYQFSSSLIVANVGRDIRPVDVIRLRAKFGRPVIVLSTSDIRQMLSDIPRRSKD